MNCYSHVFKDLFNPSVIPFDKEDSGAGVQAAQERLLHDTLEKDYNEVTDSTLKAGDIVVRTGHVGYATGDGDKISQFGFPEAILPTANRMKVLQDKLKTPGGLSKDEKAELDRLKKAFEEWSDKHSSSENEVSFKILNDGRNPGDYKVYRLKGCHSAILKPSPIHTTGGGQCR